MPTVSPEQHGPEPKPHRFRQVAESFGVDAERYDRARPRYPDALIERVVEDSPGRDVLDVGCGTGIAARQFRTAGCRVLGVEPDPRMAEFARRDGLEVEVATFEDWDPAGREFDAVVAGQAWHWVDPAAGPAKAARLLRTGGRLALFAHAFEPPAEVYEPFAAALRRAVPDSPIPVPDTRPEPGAIYQRMMATFEDGIRTAGAFTDPERWSFDWERAYTRAEYLDLLPTQGILTRVPPGPRAEILHAVGAAIDDLGGGFTMRFSTLATTATRT